MKAPGLMPKAFTMTYPPIFRAVTTAKKRKRLMLHCQYGTSPKPATTNLPVKLNSYNNLKSSSDSLLPVIWKTVAMASDLFNSITIHFKAKSENPSKETPSEDTSKGMTNEDQETFSLPATLSESGSSQPIKTKAVSEVGQIAPQKKGEDPNIEQTFFEWLSGSDVRTKRKEFLSKDGKKIEKSKKSFISKSSLQQRSRFLVSSLTDASSSGSQLLRLEDVCKHLILYPEQKSIMCKTGLIRTALRLKMDQSDQAIQAQARCALALVGYHDSPRADGIRILSIDGGGTRGIMAIETLRQLETLTNKKVYELFDFICGVSSGAILSLLVGGLRLSLDQCEYLYRRLSDEVFSQSTFWGTSRLMWSHAYYDTTTWVNVLKKTFGESLLIDTAKDKSSPKLAAISAIMNLPHLEAFVFRNYDFAPHVQSYYKGSCRYRMWEAVRASGAAPGYFEEYCLDDYLHQDGGIMINNPTALAIHEARLLWPSDPIQCVLSLGSGRYIPAVLPNFTSTSLKTKLLKMIDSATDTEAVHITVNDLLTPDTYFRINPYLTEFLNLDENRGEKLDQMKRDAQMYLRINEYKFTNVAQALCFQRSHLKTAKDWLQVQKDLLL